MTTTEEMLEMGVFQYGLHLRNVLSKHTDEAFEALLAPELLEKTQTALLALMSSVDHQLAQADNEERRLRVLGFRHVVGYRLNQVIRRMDGRGRDTSVRQWKAFAHDLALIIYDEPGELWKKMEELRAPFELNGLQWIERRLEKRGLLAPEGSEVELAA